MKKLWIVSLLLIGLQNLAYSSDHHLTTVVVDIHDTTVTANQPSFSYGTITFKDSEGGLLIIPKLKNLTPGAHGMHIHSYPQCGQQGNDGGAHLDPKNTGLHLGPYNDSGHLGDLPVLIVDSQGNATKPVVAPRLQLIDINNRSIIIHAGSDNYSDNPQPNGGGGKRIGCGVIGKGFHLT
ncbi:MAG: superoxide dismutase family protein [Gammaproteobacteria bacterium]